MLPLVARGARPDFEALEVSGRSQATLIAAFVAAGAAVLAAQSS